MMEPEVHAQRDLDNDQAIADLHPATADRQSARSPERSGLSCRQGRQSRQVAA